MRRAFYLALALPWLTVAVVSAQTRDKLLGTLPSDATSTAVSVDGRVFAAVKTGIVEIKNGSAETLVALDREPRKIVLFQQFLYVTTSDAVLRVEIPAKKSMVWAGAKDFPEALNNLQTLAVDERGVVYVADTKLNEAKVFQITQTGRGKDAARKVTLIASSKEIPGLSSVTGLAMDSMNHLIVCDGMEGTMYRLRISDKAIETVAKKKHHSHPVFDRYGHLFFVADMGTELWSIPRPGAEPVLVKKWKDRGVGDLNYDVANHNLIVPVVSSRSVFSIPAQVPGWEVDETPLSMKAEVVFKDLNYTGYDNGLDSGKEVPLRPIVLTHLGDGSNRIVIATQHGVIHSFKEGDAKTNVMLDIQAKCFYKDTENEQGLLGLAFHPNFKTNGELFVFYTDKSKRFENVVCRFRMKKDNPNQVDPASEEELLRIKHKYWNHDGGTLAFGPDGMLYVVLGDGGSANDPDGHGQMTNTLLGKILRIDINRKDPGLAYAIPKDNPFVGNKDYRPEIYATGVRNPWRLSFDRKTGTGWFGEVGQNLWEEINILEKGANYGWSVRESLHPFGPKGVGAGKEFTEPIWEYHHAIGKSITGGFVYRGSKFPELQGHYLYADYVTAKIWALKYDEKTKRVTANRPIADEKQPILSFGEDEQGELYLLTYSATGKGVWRFAKAESRASK